MTRRMQRRRRMRGQAMVEFAFAMPLFTMLVFGLASIALLFFQQESIVNGARAGVRAAAVQTVVGGDPASVSLPRKNNATCALVNGKQQEQHSDTQPNVRDAVQSAMPAIAVSTKPVCYVGAGLCFCTISRFTQAADPDKATITIVEDDTAGVAWNPGGHNVTVTVTFVAQGVALPINGSFTFAAASTLPKQMVNNA